MRWREDGANLNARLNAFPDSYDGYFLVVERGDP
jgi:hypothetical protein